MDEHRAEGVGDGADVAADQLREQQRRVEIFIEHYFSLRKHILIPVYYQTWIKSIVFLESNKKEGEK